VYVALTPVIAVGASLVVPIFNQEFSLYMYNENSWLKIGTTSDAPTAITGVNATYTLNTDGTPTIITAASTDPEGFPLTWSYAVTSGTLGDTATISQLDNVFTINPSSVEAHAGTFSITISVTDGTNITTQVVDFTLAFAPVQIGSDTIYTSGNGIYYIPSGANYVKVFVTGGGGGGGGASAYVTSWFSTGGGGGGGTAIGSKAVSGGGISYTVGAGGTGGSGQANGTSGGMSILQYTTTIFAVGYGGSRNSGATGGGLGTATSNGMVSTSLLTGGAGQNGQAQYGFNGGDGGASYYGPGGSGGNAPSANGGTTSSFGGGGGGAGTNTGTRNGGAGTSGKIVIQAWTGLPP